MNSNGKTSRRISLNEDDEGGGVGGESSMSMSSATTCAFNCVGDVVSSSPQSRSVPSKSASFLSKSRRDSSPV